MNFNSSINFHDISKLLQEEVENEDLEGTQVISLKKVDFVEEPHTFSG